MLRLAGPVIVARAGLVIMLTVDTLMTGMAGAEQIAYLGLGLSPVMIFMLAMVGLLQGAMVLVAQANGAGEYERCGAIWRVAMLHGLVLGSFFALTPLVAEDVFLWIGHAPDLAAGAAEITTQFAWGMPGLLLYVITGYLLEGIGRPRAGMIIMLLANILNVFADGIVALGWWGLVEPMGAAGAIMTTSAIRWLIFFAILGVVLTMRDRDRYGVTRGAQVAWGPIVRKMWRLGAPVAATGGIENGAYALLMQMAGLMGALALAAHQVTINVLTLAYMGANGMAAATSVRVGAAVGRGDQPGVGLSGWTGVALGAGLMACMASIFMAFPHGIASLFLHDPAALEIASRTMSAAGKFIVIAGAMAVAMGALRGAGDMVTAMLAYLVGYLLIGASAAWIFAFDLSLGAPGLIYGLMAGVAVGLVVLLWRFRIVSSRPVRRL